MSYAQHPEQNGTAVAEHDPQRDLDWLDARYLDAQDKVAKAIADKDTQTAERVFDASGSLAVVDADGATWRIAQYKRSPSQGIASDHRFSYRYRKQAPETSPVLARRGRFAQDPSLAASYASKIGGTGWIAWLVRHSEPVGYLAAAIVGLGLWLLLGDVIGDLPGIAVLVAMVLTAAGLWAGSEYLDKTRYREAQRLSAILGAAAIGVTGAIPWVVTMEQSTSMDARILITAGVVAVAALARFSRSRDAFSYFTGLAAATIAAGAAGYVFDPNGADDGSLGVQLGVLAAVAVLIPVTTSWAALRWVPAALIGLTAAGWLGVVVMDWSTVSNLHLAAVSALGLIAAGSALLSSRLMRAAMRMPHRMSAGALAVASLIVLIPNLDWEFLADIPLPVVMVVAGSATLITLAVTMRMAVQRLTRGAAPEPNGSAG